MSQNSLNPDFRQELHQTSAGERIVYYPQWDTTIRFFGNENVGMNQNPDAWPTTVLGLSWPFTSTAEINSNVIGGFAGITAQAILSSAKPVQSSVHKEDWLLIELINENLPLPQTAYQDYPLFSPARFLLKFNLPEYDTLFAESAFLNLFVYDQYNWPEEGIVAEVFLADPEADHTATWNKQSTVTGQGWTADTLLPNAFTGDWGGHGASASSGGGSIVLLGDEPPYATQSDSVEFVIPRFDDLSVPQKLKIDVTYLVQYAIASGMSGDVSFLVRARYWPTVDDDYFTQPPVSGPVDPTDPNTKPIDDPIVVPV
jgi:hypothetical protein